jgi:hypothetical protein
MTGDQKENLALFAIFAAALIIAVTIIQLT